MPLLADISRLLVGGVFTASGLYMLFRAQRQRADWLSKPPSTIRGRDLLVAPESVLLLRVWGGLAGAAGIAVLVITIAGRA